MPLTPEELAFFGTISQKAPKNQEIKKHEFEDDEFGEFQSADGSETRVATASSKQTSKSDDCGFLDFGESSIEKSSTENDLPVGSSRSHDAQCQKSSSLSNTQIDLLSSEKTTEDKSTRNENLNDRNLSTVIKPTNSLHVPIQAQIDDLSSYQTGMRFGQHMVTNKNPYTGELVSKPSKTSVSQWNGVLFSKYGEKDKTQVKVNRRRQEEPTASTLGNDLIPQLNEWAFDEDSFESPVDEFSSFQDAPAMTVKDPGDLLTIIITETLPLLADFLTGLVHLSLPLRRRAMKRPEIIAFLPGFLEIMAIAARISAGRARKSFNKNQRNAADRACNQLEDQWEQLSARLKTVLPPKSEYSLPVINSRIIFTSTTSNECVVCGLNKTEIIKGQSRPVWFDNPNGHRSCIKWWEKQMVKYSKNAFNYID